MSPKRRNAQWDLKDTAACVAREISEAGAYKRLVFNVIKPIFEDEKPIRIALMLVEYMAVAFEQGCVSALTKVFAEDSEPGLDRLVQMARAVPIEEIEARLSQGRKSFYQGRLINERAIFLAHADTYRQEIVKIRNKLKPLRDARQARDFPELARKANTTWDAFDEWVTFAERAYGQAMSAMGAGLPAGGFLPSTFDLDAQQMLDFIQSG